MAGWLISQCKARSPAASSPQLRAICFPMRTSIGATAVLRLSPLAEAAVPPTTAGPTLQRIRGAPAAAGSTNIGGGARLSGVASAKPLERSGPHNAHTEKPVAHGQADPVPIAVVGSCGQIHGHAHFGTAGNEYLWGDSVCWHSVIVRDRPIIRAGRGRSAGYNHLGHAPSHGLGSLALAHWLMPVQPAPHLSLKGHQVSTGWLPDQSANRMVLIPALPSRHNAAAGAPANIAMPMARHNRPQASENRPPGAVPNTK